MPNFELLFRMRVEDDDKSLDTDTFMRVIVADNLEMAQKIAEAMLDEEVYAREYLEYLLSLQPTNEFPDINAWDDGSYTWTRVLKTLGLKKKEIKFVFAKDAKVGITKIVRQIMAR